MHPVLYLINIVIEIITWVVIASAIVSWLVAFGVVNMRNQVVRMIVETLYRLTEPMLRPIRRFLPDLGGIDISPVVLLVGLYVLRYALNYYFLPNYY
jgi:YggT family protein